jgi:hypothetical protein
MIKIRSKEQIMIIIIIALVLTTGLTIFVNVFKKKNLKIENKLTSAECSSKIDSLEREFAEYRNLMLLQNEAVIMASQNKVSKHKLDSLDAKIKDVDHYRYSINDDDYNESLFNVSKYIKSRSKK